MSDEVKIDLKDMLDRVADQRNKALDEIAAQHAVVESLKREITDLRKQQCASSTAPAKVRAAHNKKD